MTIDTKIAQIYELIKEIEKENTDIGYVFLEGFGLSINIISAAKKITEKGEMDISEKIQIVNNILGFSLEEMVLHLLDKQAQGQMNSQKEADKDTLDFITSVSDVDDYEKFIKENSVKENLSFLSKEI
jgi:hypothetical protein